ncbi:hypothetical protein A2716_02625 [candidate division WWE3 bacterium RIFCSPHIGHO2_01_FULL_40_23]|uniref:Hydrolase TatD n=1 Tax=candidate division WWE3 bacterium RIFCSPLOWO2_01_FULL_41_18 TaxID=1802625 RepID=A0A1F4VFY1_UNCKA|nr:MAG: hypothetical protein A2716_02625 [candidate division WWE3 bacterium RIFCSPHIGHO2_01_FULL_40_23]OGC55880.1 MAG: hypothetical protein A3A78_02475 [candidate division WWE3 bacterium RIFCSPLOWO2_01_FULL_41_18]
MLIDSHCHLQEDAFKSDLIKVVQSAVSENVNTMICIGTNLKTSADAVKLSQEYKEVYASIGIYPHEEMPNTDIREEISKLSKNKKVVAIGECGLDYSENGRNQEDQKELFRKQIGTAVQLDLPLIIHNRNADEDVITELNHYRETGRLRGVFHCFTGDTAFAKRVLELGFYISFTAIVTYPSAKHLEEVIKSVPKDRILIETDAPYLSPEGMRGKRNEPKNVKIVAVRIAEILNTSLTEVAKITSENARRLFTL